MTILLHVSLHILDLPGLELLQFRVCTLPTLVDNTKLISKLIVPISILTSSVNMLQLFYTFLPTLFSCQTF